MKSVLSLPALMVALCVCSSVQAAMSPVPYLGPTESTKSGAEPNRLTGSTKGRGSNSSPPVQFAPLNPYLSLMPMMPAPAPVERRSRPGFLNTDPFDPNSDVNRYDRSKYANPYPYDPIYNPYGQGSSTYAPGGGANVPMGNGIPWGR
jgi:hypothetical protein